MAKRDPVGMIRRRSDGGVWQKSAADDQEWIQLEAGSGPGGQSGGPVAGGAGGDEGDVIAGPPGAAWSKLAQDLQLDGHVPEDVVHPVHVTHDLDGDTDSKPVLSWVDSAGAPRNSYTTRFHYNRAALAHPRVGAARPAILAAYAGVESELAGSRAPAAALALAHLVSGHSLDALATSDVYHNREQAEELPVARSHTADATHPDKVHYAVKHRRGHTILAPVHHAGLAEHHAAGKGHASADEARALLAEHGLGPEHAPHVRAHAFYHHAADALSKLPVPTLNHGGLAQIHANIEAVSGYLAEQYGHHPAPPGMSYVPPALVAAYVEEAGGARLWPRAFAALQGPAPEPTGMLPVRESAGVIDPTLEPPPEPNRAEYPFVGTIKMQGIVIDIENALGTVREGDGWSTYMHAHYGEVRSVDGHEGEVLGADGDRLDAYVGPDRLSDVVVVIQQVDPDTHAYDEDKVMLGFGSVRDAVALYRLQYDRPGFYGGHTSMDVATFKSMLARPREYGRSLVPYGYDSFELVPQDQGEIRPAGAIEPPSRVFEHEIKRSSKYENESAAKVGARYRAKDELFWSELVRANTNNDTTEWDNVVRVYRSWKYGRKQCSSTNVENNSSPDVSATSSASPPAPPTSSPPTSAPKSMTPSPSLLPSAAPSTQLSAAQAALLRPRGGAPSVEVRPADVPNLVYDVRVFASLVGDGSLLRLADRVYEVKLDGDHYVVGGRRLSPARLHRAVAMSYGVTRDKVGDNVDSVLTRVAPPHAPTRDALKEKSRARELLLRCLSAHKKGKIKPADMIDITTKHVERKFGQVIQMATAALAETKVQRSAAPPPDPTGTSRRRRYAVGEVSTYSDGSRHVKVDDHHWKDEPSSSPHENKETKGSANTSVETARARLRKLREQRARTKSPDTKRMIDQQISKLKERIARHASGEKKPTHAAPHVTPGRTKVQRSMQSELMRISASAADREMSLDHTIRELEAFTRRVARSATASFEAYCATCPGYEAGVRYLGGSSCPVHLRASAANYVEQHGHAAFVRALKGE